MVDELNILWIKPPEISLKLLPGIGSVSCQVPESDRYLSYDVQVNYPVTPLVSAMRQLQSASKRTINPSLLNLAAVPRRIFETDVWEEQYRSEMLKKIPFGSSEIGVRRIGVDIDDIPNLDDIIRGQDVIVITSSYEMGANEIKGLGSYIHEKYPRIPLMGAGLGIETRETDLLNAGFDLCFSGTITDRGEEVLEGLVNRDTNLLSRIPGVYTNLNGNSIGSVGARNFRQPPIERAENIHSWIENLPKYFSFLDPKVKFVGRPDLKTELHADSLVEYDCTFQDLPHETIVKLSEAGRNVVMGADEISLSIGCPRKDCDFCSTTGKGFSTKDLDYNLALLDYHKSIGVTDIVPTDDALLTPTLTTEGVRGMTSLFQQMQERKISLFTGNGLSTYDLNRLIEYAEKDGDSAECLKSFTDVVGYWYLPIERQYALTGENTPNRLEKLEGANQAFHRVLRHISENSQRKPIEVATNIMLPHTPSHEEIRQYYQEMDKIKAKHPKLTMRYVAFFPIPTNSASHIQKLRATYDLSFSDKYPELKVVSVPTIMKKGETTEVLENRLAANVFARNDSDTDRALQIGGTYYEREKE